MDEQANTGEGGYAALAAYYDLLTENIDYQQRGAYFHQIFNAYGKQEGLLLDLACGTGTLSEYFSALGYDVTGVDCSPEMLSVAQQKKVDAQSDTIYLCQSMQELDLYGTVDLVLCALDSLNHITDESELQAVFNRIALFLNPDSLFVFDVNTVYKHEQVLCDHAFVYEHEDAYCVWQNEGLPHAVVEITLDLFRYDNATGSYQRTREQFCERAYPMATVTHLLDQAGFDVMALYEGDTFHAPSETSQRLVFVCRNRCCQNAYATESESLADSLAP